MKEKEFLLLPANELNGIRGNYFDVTFPYNTFRGLPCHEINNIASWIVQ